MNIKLSSTLLLALFVLSCGGGGGGGGNGGESGAAASADPFAPSGEGVCGLLMQGELDEFFGSPAGVGASESFSEGVELCSWPPGNDPWLMVQVGPGVPDINQAVNLGDNYEIRPVSGLSGPSAMAVDALESGFVAVLAVQVGDKTLTVSPIGLGIPPSGPRFDSLKTTVGLMAGRL